MCPLKPVDRPSFGALLKWFALEKVCVKVSWL